MIIIKIETGNSAFEDWKNGELARILHELADKAEEKEYNNPIFDSNGNCVGMMEEVDE